LVANYAVSAKRSAALNTALRYNPFYYPRVRGLLDRVAAMGREQRRELVDSLSARALRWASALGPQRSVARSFEDWPILDKDYVRDNPGKVVNPRVFAIPAATGGTTGIPIQLSRSLLSVAAEQAFHDHMLAPFGLSFGTARIASLRGDDVKAPSDRDPPFGITANSGNHLILSAQHVTSETVDWFYEKLADFKPDIFYVYPSSGETLALRMIERGMELPLPLVMSNSEMLHPAGRKVIKEAFMGPILDHYGVSERVVFAHSRRAGEFWINPAYGRTELVPVADDDMPDGFACAEIIGTGFWNEAMPLVRYRTGDRLIYPESYDDQDLEDVTLGLKPFSGIVGRDKDFVLSARGEMIWCAKFAWDTTRIVRIQVIQDSFTALRILVVAKPGFGDSDLAVLMANVRNKVPTDMHVDVELVSELQRLPGGKVPYVIRNV
jgi:phenylacetate-CoA ligase